MKTKLNQNQILVKRIVEEEYNFYVGGLFNALEDYDENSEDYKDAVHDLSDSDFVKSVVIAEVKDRITDMGKNARFASNAWIETCVNNCIAKDEEYQAWFEEQNKSETEDYYDLKARAEMGLQILRYMEKNSEAISKNETGARAEYYKGSQTSLGLAMTVLKAVIDNNTEYLQMAEAIYTR